MSSLRGEKRTEFPLSVKKAAFARCCLNGTLPGRPQCENCSTELTARSGINYDHDLADGLGGEPTVQNCRVLCRICHEIKTGDDVAIMAKADRVAKKHFGLTKAKRPIRSAGFQKSEPQRTASRPLNRRKENISVEEN